MDYDDYLSRYAEPEAQLARGIPDAFDFAVVLPLLGEDAAVDELLASLAVAAQHVSKTALAILVVNGRAEHASSHGLANLSLWQRLAARASVLSESPEMRFGKWTDSLGVIAIDRFRGASAFAAREGVGHARKIGCDLALALHARGKIRSPYLSTTDGDATVAPNYFDWRERPRDAALIHPFAHAVESPEAFSLLLYEISLRYYVLGLRAAASPYAFHTIGSTLTVHARAYAAVRGFPKREAAEDFYLLSKLAKVGAIRTDGGEVRLAPRPSDRVPFGTGRSMSKIGEELEEGREYQLYHPEGFAWVAAWIREAEKVADGASIESAKSTLLREAGETAASLVEEAGGWSALETAVRTRKSASDRRRHFHEWFDGFRTLKFLHGARDRALGTLPFAEALARADFLPGEKAIDAATWLGRLRTIEEQAATPA